jgi:hypothetical protein
MRWEVGDYARPPTAACVLECVEVGRQGKSTYRAPKDLIARHAGVRVRTLTVANAELAAAGLILIERHFDAARKQHDVSTYSVLDDRFAEGNLTIITTNVGGRELERRWGPEYGPYLLRRIHEFCLAINFDPQS